MYLWIVFGEKTPLTGVAQNLSHQYEKKVIGIVVKFKFSQTVILLFYQEMKTMVIVHMLLVNSFDCTYASV